MLLQIGVAVCPCEGDVQTEAQEPTTQVFVGTSRRQKTRRSSPRSGMGGGGCPSEEWKRGREQHEGEGGKRGHRGSRQCS